MILKPLERETERECNRIAEKAGWLHIKLDKAARGWPDQIYFGPACQKLIVEFKRSGQNPRPQQAANHRRLDYLGHPVTVVRSVDHFRKLLAQHQY